MYHSNHALQYNDAMTKYTLSPQALAINFSLISSRPPQSSIGSELDDVLTSPIFDSKFFLILPAVSSGKYEYS